MGLRNDTTSPCRNPLCWDEFRAILRLAGTELRKRNIGRKDSPLLQLMRRVLREARVVAKAERERMD